MSRRRKTNISPPPPRRVRNTHAERPTLDINIKMLTDGKVEVDPKFNDALIEHFDILYQNAQREEYEPDWTDDHKVAFFVRDLMDGFLAQWDTPISPDEVDGEISDVPHIKDSPVVDRLDISTMEVVK